jgi:hypothetical protein
MATKDLHNNVHVIPVINPATITAVKAADNAVDLSVGGIAGGATNQSGPAESCEIVAQFGAISGTTPSATLLVEESDDNSTYTSVAAADLIGGLAPAAIDATYANTVVKRGYRGTKRYVRARISAMSGTSPSYALAVGAVLSHVRHAPTPAGN